MGDVSPATEISQAAAHIRELATAATPGEWRHESSWRLRMEPRLTGVHEAVVFVPPNGPYNTVALTGFLGEHPGSAADAAHIALWQPSNVLLLADLLDAAAGHWDSRDPADFALYADLPIAPFVRAINAHAEQWRRDRAAGKVADHHD